jgi:hypothetical protein
MTARSTAAMLLLRSSCRVSGVSDPYSRSRVNATLLVLMCDGG